MKQLRLWPQSLVGQIIILVAIALFVAQAINFGLLLRERNRVELTSQTAPLVYRVINALDTRPDRVPDRDHPRANQDRDRRNIDFLASRPTLSGKPRPDVAARAGAMFEDIGLTVRTIEAAEDSRIMPLRRWEQIRSRATGEAPRDHRVGRLTLAVEYEPGKWLTTEARIGSRPPRARALLPL